MLGSHIQETCSLLHFFDNCRVYGLLEWLTRAPGRLALVEALLRYLTTSIQGRSES